MTTDGGARERDLRVVAAAIGISALGDAVAFVALGLRANELAGSGMDAGLSIAAVFICLWAPAVVLAGHVGLLVDRVETRGLLVLVSAGQAVVAVALAFVGSMWALFGLTALLGVGVAISQASEFALVPSLAASRELQRVNSLVETTRSLGFVFGPALGGFLMAAGGISTAMLVDAASFVAIAIAGLTLSVRRYGAGHGGERKRRARDGVALLFGDRLLAVVMTVGMVSLLFMSASIPADLVYADDVLGVGETGFGLVITAWTVGMLVGSNVVARRLPFALLGVAALGAVAVQGLGKAITPLWMTLGFMVVCYAIGGVGHGTKNVAFRTLIHHRVPAERHGAAFAAYSGLRNAAELGALGAGGVLVGALGGSAVLVLAGGLSALVGLGGVAVLLARPVAEPQPGASTIGSP